tara:strand:- start:44 stop:814 length:771 start_codon:yes stop_codon:yes gene_type:complete
MRKKMIINKPVLKSKEKESELYNNEYFLNEYFEHISDFNLKTGNLSFTRQRQVDLLGFKKDDIFLDVGCGRGDVLLNVSRRGIKCVGIDYSRHAIKLASKLLAGQKNVTLIRSDVNSLNSPNNTFDKVLLGDMIEHLSKGDGLKCLKEVYRVLKKNGKVVVHTAPNLYFIKFIYPIIRMIFSMSGRKSLIEKLNYHRKVAGIVHKNEFTPMQLYRLMKKAGFETNVFLDRDILRNGDSMFTKSLANPHFFHLWLKS